MKTATAVRGLVAAALLAGGLGAFAPAATAQTAPVQLAPAAAADAYGLDVDVTLTPLDIEVDEGPFARATQEFPPQAAAADEDEVLGAGPIPAGGEVVDNIGVLSSLAGANGTPLAVASAQAVDVALLAQGGAPMITADVITAQSSTDCVNDPSAAGTEFVNLRVAGIEAPFPDPAPNTVLAPEIFSPLGLKVVVNEQHPTADGRGLVVNGIHIYGVTGAIVPGIFSGDVIVSHAMSTVNCPNGKGTTGTNNPIFITKDVNKSTAKPGDELTYTATVQNKAPDACLVNQFIDHLPSAFEFVSTSGAFGTVAALETRPGGGVDAILKPEGLTIPAGGSATQTFVVKVREDAVPGVYFNNVEILCANLGNWVKGLDAPVQVTTNTVVEVPKPQCSDGVDNDGDGKIDYPVDPGCDSPQDNDERDAPRTTLPRTGDSRELYVLSGLLLVGAAVATRRFARA